MTNERFRQALTTGGPDYGIVLSEEAIQGLVDYYALLMRWNERLHLVAPCEPEEFATRHVMESLMLLRFLPSAASLVDIGSGGGLPVIPCLIAREDLFATLIESSQKKAVFLREALKQSGRLDSTQVIAKTFEETPTPAAKFVTCRALDQFTRKLGRIVSWSPPTSTLVLYGGEILRRELDTIDVQYTEFLIPFSEKRFIYEVKRTRQS